MKTNISRPDPLLAPNAPNTYEHTLVHKEALARSSVEQSYSNQHLCAMRFSICHFCPSYGYNITEAGSC